MRKWIFPVLALATVSACGSEPAEKAPSEQAEYSVDEDSGEVKATIETKDGTATFRSGADVPVDLPTGFTLYPGAAVTSNSRFEQGGDNQVVLLSFESEDSGEKIADFYRDAAVKAGFEISIDATMNGGHLITGKAKKGGVFTLSTSTEEGTTKAQLTTGLGDIAP